MSSLRLLAGALVALSAAACGSAVSTLGADAATDAAPADAGAIDGAEAMDAPPPSPDGGACVPLTNDAPAARYTCPGAVCPGCAPPSTGGGAIQDGTYFFVGGQAYFSACGILTGEDSHGKIVVHGSTIDYAYAGPVNFASGDAGQGEVQESYRFSVSGDKITLTQTCTTNTPGTRAADFSAHGDILALPIGVWASPSYYKRQ